MENPHPHPYRFQEATKRLFDIAVALLGLLLLTPVFLVIAILVKRESPGPVFYLGRRTGKGGVPFNIIKFRTMYDRPASYKGPSITGLGDNRVTPLGHWLRDTKLNELPQLWNVLRGEMSLVGPRPEDAAIASNWPEAIHNEILSLRPGITGPAAIIYRDEEKMLQADTLMDDYLKIILPDKLRLDRLYVRHHRFLSDIDLIFWTFLTSLPYLRKAPIPAESLYNGLLSRFMRRYFSWFLIDNLVAFAAVSLAGIIWRLGGPLDLGVGLAIGVAAGIALLFSLINSILGLSRVWWRHAQPSYAFDLAFSCGFSTLIVIALDLVWPTGHFLPLGMIIVASLLAFLGFLIVRYRERLLTGLATRWLRRRQDGAQMGERLLIVGAGECSQLATWLLQRSKLSAAFTIVGLVDDDPLKQGMTFDGYRVIGFTHTIPELVRQKDIGVILFAIERIQPEEHKRILDLCRQTPARVVVFPDVLDFFRERLSQSFQEAVA